MAFSDTQLEPMRPLSVIKCKVMGFIALSLGCALLASTGWVSRGASAGWVRLRPASLTSKKHEHATSSPLETPRRQRILVTGGMGNIGVALCSKLLNMGMHTVVADVYDLAEPRTLAEDNTYSKYYKASVMNVTSLRSIMVKEDITGVIHLAAVSRVQWCLDAPDHCRDVNVEGTRIVVDAVNAISRVQWLIFASSREVYGGAPNFPVNEGTPRSPLNIYGITKSDAETVIEQVSAKPTIVLRLSNVYGGLNDHAERLIPSLLTKCLLDQPVYVTGGQQVMDFTYIDDVVAAFLQAARRLSEGATSKMGPLARRMPTRPLLESFNIVSGTATRVSDLLKGVQELTETLSPVVRLSHDPRFPARYEADPALAQSRLGFRARVVDVRVGLALYRDALQRLWARALAREARKSCASPDAALPARIARWVCSPDLPKIKSCAYRAVSFPGMDRVFEGTLDSAYRANVSSHSNQTLELCLNAHDNMTYLVQSQTKTVMTRADVFNCKLPDSPQSDPSRLKLLYSTTEAQFERLRLKNYGLEVPTTGSAWHARCRVLQKALQTLNARMAGPRQKPGTRSRTRFTVDVARWPKFKNPSCSVDCSLPQVCIFDGHCSCPPTGVACFGSDTNAKLRVRGHGTRPHEIAGKLPPESVMLEHAAAFWKETSEHAYADGHGMTIRLARPAPPSIPASNRKGCSEYKDTGSRPGMAPKMHLAMQYLPSPENDTTMWVVPHYNRCDWETPRKQGVLDTAKQRYHMSHNTICIIVEHEFGTCNEFKRHPIEHIATPLLQPFASGAKAVSTMGDILLPCMNLVSTAIVPGRSTVPREELANLRDVHRIKNVLDRKYVLVHESSKSSVIQMRLSGWLLGFGMAHENALVAAFEGAGDYLSAMNNAQFCLHTRGTTGWATRLADMLYAGCIPVIVMDDTVHPYETMLDYRKFSIRVHERDVARTRDILASLSDDDKVYLQAHVLRVRDVFMYRLDEVDRLDDADGLNPIRLLLMDLLRLRRSEYPL